MIAVADALAGAVFVAVGVLTIGRPGSRRFAIVSALGGVAWLAGNVSGSFSFLHRPLMAHAALSYPTGRLPSRATRAVVAVAWLGAVIVPVGHQAGVTVLFGLAMLAVAATRLARDRRDPQVRATGVSCAATAVLASAFMAPAALRLLVPVSPIADEVTLAHAVTVSAAGVILLAAGQLRIGGAADVADVVVELADMRPADVDALEAVERQGRTPVASDDPALQVALETAADLLKEHTMLQAELQAQVDEVRRARRRLVEVADVESRRLQRMLDEGPGERIGALEQTLGELAPHAAGDAMVSRVQTEVAALQDDLNRLARGLHPRRLDEEGLRAALVDLAGRIAMPIEVVVPSERLPPAVETTLWYVCAEAVANAGKHAGAREMRISVEVKGTEAVATVVDDGAGGARFSAGRGLTGLADRLDAVGGRLEVADRRAGGTCVRAWVPVA